jgi:hypothetical protein
MNIYITQYLMQSNQYHIQCLMFKNSNEEHLNKNLINKTET